MRNISRKYVQSPTTSVVKSVVFYVVLVGAVFVYLWGFENRYHSLPVPILTSDNPYIFALTVLSLLGLGTLGSTIQLHFLSNSPLRIWIIVWVCESLGAARLIVSPFSEELGVVISSISYLGVFVAMLFLLLWLSPKLVESNKKRIQKLYADEVTILRLPVTTFEYFGLVLISICVMNIYLAIDLANRGTFSGINWIFSTSVGTTIWWTGIIVAIATFWHWVVLYFYKHIQGEDIGVRVLSYAAAFLIFGLLVIAIFPGQISPILIFSGLPIVVYAGEYDKLHK